MGIDVYLKWTDMTKGDKQAEITGFDIYKGDVGYLREAYHGGPYATEVLVSENWDKQPKGGFAIANSVLQERLPLVVATAKARAKLIYKAQTEEQDMTAQAFIDFVAFHKEKEDAGLNPKIVISA